MCSNAPNSISDCSFQSVTTKKAWDLDLKNLSVNLRTETCHCSVPVMFMFRSSYRN